jgi:hypothetical protein
MKSAMWRSLAIDASTGFTSVGAASFVDRSLRALQGTDLTGCAGHNLVARPSLNLAVCPSAACSPPLFANVPHAIASSRAVLRRSRLTTRSLQANAQAITAYCLCKGIEHSSHCRPLPAANPLHNVQQQIQGAAMRFAIKFTARASGLKASSTSRLSLTGRSMGRLHHRSLRQSHAGAPYLWR